MSKVAIGCLGVIGIGFLVVIIFALGALGYRSSVVTLQNQVEAQYTANKSNYDSMWKKFKEMTQVTDLQAEQFKDVYTALIEGRNQDQNLLFKMIKEDNPKLSSKVYEDLQREIASGRNVFDNNQKKLIDIIREYNTRIDTGMGFIYNMLFNYQHIDPNKYIVTSDKTEGAFTSGKDDEIKLR